MLADNTDYEAGETPMTDYQAKLLTSAISEVLDASNDLDEARTRFCRISNGGDSLSINANASARVDGETPMSDYQFQAYEKLINELDALACEVAKLREELAKLKDTSSKT